MNNIFLSIDIGGSYIKGASFQLSDQQSLSVIPSIFNGISYVRVPSRLSSNLSVTDFILALDELLNKLLPKNSTVSGIGISTAGIVNYSGSRVICSAEHLTALTDDAWVCWLSERTGSSVTLINDADATAIGASCEGLLYGNQTIGIMPVGTGLGFVVWRNSRKWTPSFSYTLLGTINTPAGTFDELVSLTKLAQEDKDRNLLNIFAHERNHFHCNSYIDRLADVIRSASSLYSLDKIFIGGGLADVVNLAGYPLESQLNKRLSTHPPFAGLSNGVSIMNSGNKLPLLGAALLAVGESRSLQTKVTHKFKDLKTEKPYNSKLQINKMSSLEIINTIFSIEKEAGMDYSKWIYPTLTVTEKIVENLERGGRIIYVGCGTSGRIAAIDAIEIACTFGFPRDKVLSFISGGVADAAIEIEQNFEEDASSIPELLLANISSIDIIIGISVSGTAWYVQSALGFAKSIGSYTVMIQEKEMDHHPFCDIIIPLCTGNELIAGSTRMKAGTATKKIINCLSTSSMIKLGKVYGSYMVDLECLNEKLVKRAIHILELIFGLSEKDAISLLKENEYNLRKAIRKIESSVSISPFSDG